MTHKETRNIKFEKKNKEEDGASQRDLEKYIYHYLYKDTLIFSRQSKEAMTIV